MLQAQQVVPKDKNPKESGKNSGHRDKVFHMESINNNQSSYNRYNENYDQLFSIPVCLC